MLPKRVVVSFLRAFTKVTGARFYFLRFDLRRNEGYARLGKIVYEKWPWRSGF